MTTTLGAAAGCLGTAAIGFVEKQYIDPGYVYNGVLAGLVSITSPCAVVSPFGAIVVGLIGSLVYVGASKGVKAAGIDDAVDAFAVHGACGAWGVIACGLFATPFYYSVSYYGDRKDDCAGIFYGGKASGSFAAAFACVFVILAWVGSTMGALFGTLKVTGLLRVSQEIEDAGARPAPEFFFSARRRGAGRLTGPFDAQASTTRSTAAPCPRSSRPRSTASRPRRPRRRRPGPSCCCSLVLYILSSNPTLFILPARADAKTGPRRAPSPRAPCTYQHHAIVPARA